LEISKITGYLGNFPKTSIWKISQILRHLKISQIPKHLGNFPDSQALGKFPSYPGIWEIPRMPGYLGNFQSFEKFPKS